MHFAAMKCTTISSKNIRKSVKLKQCPIKMEKRTNYKIFVYQQWHKTPKDFKTCNKNTSRSFFRRFSDSICAGTFTLFMVRLFTCLWYFHENNIFITCSFVFLYYIYIWLIGFYVTPTQYRSFGDVPALLVKEDLKCPSLHYFRHERAPE
jgi:hypothetical protein